MRYTILLAAAGLAHAATSAEINKGCVEACNAITDGPGTSPESKKEFHKMMGSACHPQMSKGHQYLQTCLSSYKGAARPACIGACSDGLTGNHLKNSPNLADLQR